MSLEHGLEIGDVLSNSEITAIFKCSFMGGMRRSKRTSTLVLIADHTKEIYEDRWVGDELHYTGMGKEGNQDLHSTQNRTLLESPGTDIKVHLFEVLTRNEYTYKGQVILSGDPYVSEQEDIKGKTRKVWIFPLRIL